MFSPVKISMFCTPVSKYEILKIIANFSNTRSPGPNDVTPKLLKAAQIEILLLTATALVQLFIFRWNSSCCIKDAKVIPVHKKAEKHLVSNYRPISLLSVFDKILEKLMYFRLYNYLTANKLTY